MQDDSQLLREYVVAHSESAFAELVQRHVSLIYSAALRQMDGDAHQAQDVTQLVFADLARKASRLLRHTSLSGWLYTSVRFAATSTRRASQRRQQREQQALAMHELLNAQESEPNWDALKPALDDAMHALRDKERHAILLRYFDSKTLAQVGQALGLNENAARKRVDRSLEKLRAHFSRKGICLTTAGLAAALQAQAVLTAPAGLAAAITTSSLAAAGGVGASLTIVNLIAMTKLKIAAALVAAGMTTAIVLQYQANGRLHSEIAVLQEQSRQIPALQEEKDRLAKALADVKKPLAQAQLDELLRLRGQVGLLKKQATESGKARVATARQEKPSSDSEDEESPEKTMAIQKLNCAKHLMLASIIYAQANQGTFPADFATAVAHLGKGVDDSVLQWTNSFDLTYQGTLNAITNPANTIVFREKEAFQSNGHWLKAYGFADGHSEIHASSDGNFDEWEAARIQKNEAH